MDTSALSSSPNPIENADWDLDVEIDWGDFIDGAIQAMKQFFTDLWNGFKNVVNFIANKAKELWNGIVNLSKQIGGYVNDVVDQFKNVNDIGDAIAVFGNLVLNAGKALTALGRQIFESLKNVVGQAAAAVGNAISDGYDAVQSGWSRFTGSNDGEIRKRWTSEIDPAWDCYVYRIEERRCRTVYWPAKCSWYGGYPDSMECCNCCGWFLVKKLTDQNCIDRKNREIQQLKGQYDKSSGLDDCEKDANENSQGLEWAANNANMADLDARITPNQNVNIGKLSAQSGSSCTTIPIGINVKTLDGNRKGTSGSRQGTSINGCVDFSSDDSIAQTMETMKLQVSEQTADISRGNLGEVNQRCRNLAGITDGNNFSSGGSNSSSYNETDIVLCYQPFATASITSATIDCDEADKINLKKIFGSSAGIVLNYDTEICEKEPNYYFVFNQEKSDVGNQCNARVWYFDLYFRDCCGQLSDPLEFAITVKRIPIEITTSPGSLDKTFMCGNIAGVL